MADFLISIVGPTAIGKTTKSIALAEIFKTQILSADSRQFYKEMNIGTAVPTPEELTRVRHHFIQHLSIDQKYDVGNFEQDALQKTAQLFREHKYVILVGGSGLYSKALTEGLDYFPKVKPKLREDLNEHYKHEGIKALQDRLKSLDPVYAEKVDLNNPRRIIRALEICIGSGKPYSSFLNQTKEPRPFHTIKIGLQAPREILYQRIEKRVDLMLNDGLLDEVKSLLPQSQKQVLTTIGYKELYHYLNGDWSYNQAVKEIKKNTRRFAKRQLTWFRKDKNIHWFPYDCSSRKIAAYIQSKTG